MNSHAGDLRLVGGRLCLDFVNTVDDHRKLQPKEYLLDYAAFVAWGRHVGMLDRAAQARLLREAAQRPQVADMLLGRTRALRHAFYQLFSAVARREPPALAERCGGGAALAALNAALADAPQRSRIAFAPPGFGWVRDDERDPLGQPVWTVLWSAADLLTAADLALVGECAGEGCSWLFLDTSRNRSRRWCSMEDCGNRAKARRHYARIQLK
jgi:predicted RNA-binding Zn ribbon-like protein